MEGHVVGAMMAPMSAILFNSPYSALSEYRAQEN
jgi:hypothetical protein